MLVVNVSRDVKTAAANIHEVSEDGGRCAMLQPNYIDIQGNLQKRLLVEEKWVE